MTRVLFVIMLLGAGLFNAAASLAEGTAEGARAFADDLASRALSIIDDENLSKTGKQNALEEMFENSVDLNWVARFVLGKHWRDATEQQRQQYVKYYKAFVIGNFTGQLVQYSGQQYEIRQVMPEGEPGEFLLTIELQNANEPPVYLDYRIREKNGRYYIFDIMIEGVSLITTQRSEFNSVVSSKGLDFLISALKKKAEQQG